MARSCEQHDTHREKEKEKGRTEEERKGEGRTEGGRDHDECSQQAEQAEQTEDMGMELVETERHTRGYEDNHGHGEGCDGKRLRKRGGADMFSEQHD